MKYDETDVNNTRLTPVGLSPVTTARKRKYNLVQAEQTAVPRTPTGKRKIPLFDQHYSSTHPATNTTTDPPENPPSASKKIKLINQANPQTHQTTQPQKLKSRISLSVFEKFNKMLGGSIQTSTKLVAHQPPKPSRYITPKGNTSIQPTHPPQPTHHQNPGPTDMDATSSIDVKPPTNIVQLSIHPNTHPQLTRTPSLTPLRNLGAIPKQPTKNTKLNLTENIRKGKVEKVSKNSGRKKPLELQLEDIWLEERRRKENMKMGMGIKNWLMKKPAVVGVVEKEKPETENVTCTGENVLDVLADPGGQHCNEGVDYHDDT